MLTLLEKELLASLAAIRSTLDDEACTCDDRSWRGEEHDTACPLAYLVDADRAIQHAHDKLGWAVTSVVVEAGTLAELEYAGVSDTRDYDA